MRRINHYFFGEETIDGADWTDKAVYYGFPVVSVAGIVFASVMMFI